MKKKQICFAAMISLLAFTLVFTGCLTTGTGTRSSTVAQKVIAITGLSNFNGKHGMLTLDTGGSGSKTQIAWSMPTVISDGTLTNYMLDWVTDKPWGKDGTYMLILSITETSDPKSKALFDGFIMSRQVSGETVSMPFSQFTSTK